MKPWAVLGLGLFLVVAGGGLAVVGVDYSWTYYWIGFGVLSLGVLVVVAGAESIK